jgi:hypothetical protein
MAFLLADSAALKPDGALRVEEVKPPHDTRPETDVCETLGVFSSGFGGSGGGLAALRAFRLANSAAVRVAGPLGVESFVPHAPPIFGLNDGRGADCDEVELASLSPAGAWASPW